MGRFPRESSSTSRRRTSLATSTDPVLEARSFLETKGWKWNETEGALARTSGKETIVLAFSLSTANAPDLRATAEFLRSTWERMGAKVEVKIFEQGDLNQNVIRPRKYDALLFGEVVGRELDLFAFWHSSQRNDPGLNIALYANSVADQHLETLRTSTDLTEKRTSYQKFAEELKKDVPAIFLYTPDFMYIFPERIQGLSLGSIGIPSERFLSAHLWHTETDRVWSFFTH
jgi:peptide/nickel transport system substrate-binding protein